ncbi:hypothetical protein [Holospora curviuscula]|uniref:hypothetical protein n=1 Tax=Holospora curviuscula TaxID=1082868 RepID=UPI001A9C71F2|nr:hypothetical protein [Holospora curviuscula]
MGANHCGISYDSLRISICCKGIEDHFPHTDLRPSYQAFVNPRVFPVRFWQGTLRRTLAGNPHHGIDKFLVIVTSRF